MLGSVARVYTAQYTESNPLPEENKMENRFNSCYVFVTIVNIGLIIDKLKSMPNTHYCF